MQTLTSLTGLSSTLQEQFQDWLERRKPQEEEMLRCYEDNMRIQRDSDTSGTGISKSQKSKVFIGSTRSKIRSARAKIKDVMFGTGKMPFDTNPSNEKLKQYADTMEDILVSQMEEGRFRKTIEGLIDSMCVYGTGFNFGPFVETKTYTSVQPNQGKLAEQKMDYPCPYFENALTMDVYPDPDAEGMDDARGVYWGARKTPEFIRALKGKPGYDDDAIDRALTETIEGTTSEGSDRNEDSRQNLYRYTQEGRIWFLRYFGTVKAKELSGWKNETPSDDDDERVEAIVIMAGGHVIKAERNVYKDERRAAYRCAYEEVEHEMWGVGIAKNNEPNQRVTNAAFRLYLEGKAMALMKMFSADRSKFEASEDFKLFPGKRFQMLPNLTPDERKTALIWHDIQDVTTGWERVIELSEGFSDDDTGITKYTQGTDSSNLNKTATGISMIMSASSLPIKEVISHVDRCIEEMIEALIDWDMEFLEPEVVSMILGPDKGKVWAEIKAYGKTNFMQWNATGSSTFMAREVLANKLNGFLQLASSNPLIANNIDFRELTEQVWDVMQIGKESPVYSDEDLQTKQNNPIAQKAQQMIQQVQQEAQQKIAGLQKQLDMANQKAKDRQTELQIKQEAEDDKRHATAIGLLQDSAKESNENVKILAEIDLIQAQTALALRQAGEQPSPELLTEAQEVEHGQTGAGNEPASGDGAELAASEAGAGQNQGQAGGLADNAE